MNANYEWQKFIVKERQQGRLREAEAHRLLKRQVDGARNNGRRMVTV